MQNRNTLTLACLVLAVGTRLHAETAYLRTVHTPTLPIEFRTQALRLHYGTLKSLDSSTPPVVYFSFSVGKVTNSEGKKVFDYHYGLKHELCRLSLQDIAKLRRTLTAAQVVAAEWAGGQPLGDEIDFQQVIVSLGDEFNLRLSRKTDEPTAFFLFTGHPERGTTAILADASNFLEVGRPEAFISLTKEIIERIDASIKHLRSVYPRIDKQIDWNDLLGKTIGDDSEKDK
jgi:hypothetical protein